MKTNEKAFEQLRKEMVYFSQRFHLETARLEQFFKYELELRALHKSFLKEQILSGATKEELLKLCEEIEPPKDTYPLLRFD